jgi:hypothetical protein
LLHISFPDLNPQSMNRREAVQKITFLLGGTISAPLMAGVMGEKLNFGPSLAISDQQEALLADIADVIIPTTSTPGAKAAGAEKFITRLMRDCYVLEDQKKFYSGLDKIDALGKEVYGKGFSALDLTQKNDIVKRTTVADKPFFLQLKALLSLAISRLRSVRHKHWITCQSQADLTAAGRCPKARKAGHSDPK